MSIKTKKVNFTTKIDNQNTDVFLAVTIGNAQIGASIVKWKNTTDIIKKGEISNLNLGNGANILNNRKTLQIRTNILDVNPSTNGVVVTYYFHNATPSTLTLNNYVENEGDIFSFDLDVEFNN